MCYLPALWIVASSVGVSDESVQYLRDVKPILTKSCVACHGALKQRGSLRLDTFGFLKEGGGAGPVIVPGDADKSTLIQHLLGTDGKKRMPPPDEGEALKPAQVATLKRWIAQGAPAPTDEKPEADPADHWAFQTPKRPDIPKVRDAAWGKNPIDAFLARTRDKAGLAHQSAEERTLLLRRVYLDLIGLPPSRAEIRAFVDDPSPNAYETVVDRLLNSPHYGERWGRHWMDIWRYSDWWGLGAELRNSQKHIWHWRDWIVESLNRDKGYDRMVQEMIAGDELFPTDRDAIRGTGFLARQYFKFNRTTWLDETIEHTSKAFLGITFNCAKCHDHKYDPISQTEYYRFRAIFEPYQIRLDMVPGETDFEKNGVPRVFDCNLDAPTYYHLRGNEGQPDKDRKITPALPKLLASTALKFEPIQLPAESHSPGLADFVMKNYEAEFASKRKNAEARLAKANQLLAQAKTVEKNAPPPTKEEAKVLVRESFTKLEPTRWKVGEGDWVSEKAGISQKKDGLSRSFLRLLDKVPDAFEARLRFTTLGGSMYRSVGISFDVTPSQETLVYMTSYAPQNRVQVAYKKSGTDFLYPQDAQKFLPVPLNVTHELVVRVRESLVNVEINGQHALAYRLPNGRTTGSLELITFDALARFEGFELRTLPKSASLVPSGSTSGSEVASVAQAEKMRAWAEKEMHALEMGLEALRARHQADLESSRNEASDTAKKAVQIAARAEKRLALAEAEANLAKHGFDNQVPKGKKAVSAPQLEKAVEAAKKALETPGDKHTPIMGALKTLENNLESEASRRKPFPKTSTGRRAALAKWMTDRSNPLLARVAVNHVWTRHFGQPLVPAIFDFGRKSPEPLHAELLDWLAVELMDHGWSMKHLHRLMVTSQAFRMKSSTEPTETLTIAQKKDPDNKYYWRMNPSRMESQVVRDSMLSLAGELDLTLGGPSIAPGEQETTKRRSLYFFQTAIERNRFLTTFDEADPLDCYRRRESIIPQQALALSNGRLAIQMSAKIRERLERDLAPNATHDDFTRAAFPWLLGTAASDSELQACRDALAQWEKIFQKQSTPDRQKSVRNHLIQALLNHNDFVTIR